MDRRRPNRNVRNSGSAAANERNSEEESRNDQEDTVFDRYFLRHRRHTEIHHTGGNNYGEDNGQRARRWDAATVTVYDIEDSDDYSEDDEGAQGDHYHYGDSVAGDEDDGHGREDISYQHEESITADEESLADNEDYGQEVEEIGHHHEESGYINDDQQEVIEAPVATVGNETVSDDNEASETGHEAREDATTSPEDRCTVQNVSSSSSNQQGVKRKASEAAGAPPSKRANPELMPPCPVCKLPLRAGRIMAAQCGHVTCRSCMQVILSGTYQKRCPTCRVRISRRSVLKIYLF